MDIIELLEKDHDNMRRKLVGIKKQLVNANLGRDLREFMEAYELHESIEEEILLPQINKLSEEQIEHESLFGYEQMHTKIWVFLDDLRKTMAEGGPRAVQESFFRFFALTEAHFGYEERALFPAARKYLSRETLGNLGRKAEERFARFPVPGDRR